MYPEARPDCLLDFEHTIKNIAQKTAHELGDAFATREATDADAPDDCGAAVDAEAAQDGSAAESAEAAQAQDKLAPANASVLDLTESVCIHLNRQMLRLLSDNDISAAELQEGCQALGRLAVTDARQKIKILASSQLSKTVYKLRKHKNAELAAAALLVVNKWTQLLKPRSASSTRTASANTTTPLVPAAAVTPDAVVEARTTMMATESDAMLRKRTAAESGLEKREAATKHRKLHGGKPQRPGLASEAASASPAATSARPSAKPPPPAAPQKASAPSKAKLTPVDTISEAFGELASDSDHRQLNKMSGVFIGRAVLMKWNGIGWQLGVIEAFKDKSYYVEYGRRAATLTADDLVRRHCSKLTKVKDGGVHDKFPIKFIGKKKSDRVGSWALLRP